jgi:integrase/recombinase XerD
MGHDPTEHYLRYLRVLNLSETTVRGHAFHLRRFIRYLQGRDPASVTRETINAYQVHLYEEINFKGRPNSAASQNNALKVVKSFYAFFHEKGYIPGDPAKDVSYAKVPTRLPRSILTKTEMRKLLHMPDTTTLLGYRDRTILEVLYSSGIRKEELNNLLLDDVDSTRGFLRVNEGKGKKDRVVPLGKIACRYLTSYIAAVRPALVKAPSRYLFLSMKGNRLSKNMLWQMIKTYAKKARITKTVSPHTFRHTCATLMLRNKANIRHIQEMLGHASLTSTQVYTSVSIVDLKEVHSKCHPREKDKE